MSALAQTCIPALPLRLGSEAFRIILTSQKDSKTAATRMKTSGKSWAATSSVFGSMLPVKKPDRFFLQVSKLRRVIKIK